LDAMSSDPFRGTAAFSGHAPAVRRGDRQHATIIVLPSTFTKRPVVLGATVETLTVHGLRTVFVYPTGGSWSLRV
jgi:hypothetical protein